MDLYFRNSIGKRRIIAKCASIEEVTREINSFLNEHNFKSYYTRIWYEKPGKTTPYEIVNKGRFIYDVGSHSEFFELEIENNEIEALPEQMYSMIKGE